LGSSYFFLFIIRATLAPSRSLTNEEKEVIEYLQTNKPEVLSNIERRIL